MACAEEAVLAVEEVEAVEVAMFYISFYFLLIPIMAR